MTPAHKSASRADFMVYVAGPLTGPTVSDWWNNVMLARQATMKLLKEGFTPVCPHLNSFLMEGVVPYDSFIERDLVILKRCDTILMMQGWGDSKGATTEHAFALENGIPAFYSIGVLSKWADQRMLDAIRKPKGDEHDSA